MPPDVAKARRTTTLSGVGDECPSRAACQLDFALALADRDQRFEGRLGGIDDRLSGIDGRLDGIERHLEGLRGEFRTAVGMATPGAKAAELEVDVGKAKVRGRAWVVVVVAVAVVLFAAIWQGPGILEAIK
jgi:hypothetical protein